MLIQNDNGQVNASHSVTPVWIIRALVPSIRGCTKRGRVHYGMVKDGNALAAFQRLCRAEGILPALESSHALAWVLDHPHEFKPGQQVVVNLFGPR